MNYPLPELHAMGFLSNAVPGVQVGQRRTRAALEQSEPGHWPRHSEHCTARVRGDTPEADSDRTHRDAPSGSLVLYWRVQRCLRKQSLRDSFKLRFKLWLHSERDCGVVPRSHRLFSAAESRKAGTAP
eukprot:3509005-Rhodomonas_salina.1